MSATPPRTQRRNELRDTRQRRRSKEGLTPARARELDAIRKLPPKHPSVRNSEIDDEFVTPSDGMFDRCLNYLRRNEVVQALHCQLREHPGTPSVLPIEALLLGMMLALIVYKTYLRADAHKMLVGLSAYQACQVGLCNPETGWLPFSYEMVQEQIKNIEAALHEGWDESLSLPWNIPNPDEPMNPSWIDKTSKTSNWGMLRFAVVMLRHSIPRAARRAATHGALDSTTIPTWARLLDARKEKVAQAELAANPPPAVPVGQLPPIGTNGPYGRIRRTKCPDALPAYKGGTPSESSGMNSGFDGHMLTFTRDGIWTGHAKHYAEGDPVPNYVPMVIVKPGLVEYLDTGIDLLDLALLVVPNLRHVSADQGYTQAHRFKDALREMGIDLAFDMDAKTAARCIAIHAGKKHGGEQLLMNSSAIFPPWLPKDMHAPPKNLTSTELQEWLDNRFDRYGYVCVNRYPNGAIRVMCPQCAGKISTSLKTRRSTTPRHKTKPPYLHIDGPYEYCCGGVRTIHPDQLSLYQHIPHGTTAWRTLYHYRIPAEGTNSRLKDRHALERGWCRAFGIAATAVGTILHTVILNLRIASKKSQAEHPTGHPTEPRDIAEQQHADTAETSANSRGPPLDGVAS